MIEARVNKTIWIGNFQLFLLYKEMENVRLNSINDNSLFQCIILFEKYDNDISLEYTNVNLEIRANS
jgi:hypothetical protein